MCTNQTTAGHLALEGFSQDNCEWLERLSVSAALTELDSWRQVNKEPFFLIFLLDAQVSLKKDEYLLVD